MRVLHDAAGRTCWITVLESETTRYLELDGCEEGAMYLRVEEPVFHYLKYHKASRLVTQPPRRLLVLGAGAFTAAKCLALDHPESAVDAVDVEPELETIGRRFFRLERPEFARIAFHGVAAEQFLAGCTNRYDFIFDDLFDGFHHVPARSRSLRHFQEMDRLLAEDGVCVKNVIWDPRSADTESTCAEAEAALAATFSVAMVAALGNPRQGHNRLLIGLKQAHDNAMPFAERLQRAGIERELVRDVRRAASGSS